MLNAILKRRREATRGSLSLVALRQLNERFAALLTGLVDWPVFTLDAFQAALATRQKGVIERRPFHWADASVFGLTLGVIGADQRPHWFILYESETDSDHQLAIILHELMHIALGHAQAAPCLGPEDLRNALRAVGLLSDAGRTPIVTFTRMCRPDDRLLSPTHAVEEREAELGAMWVLTQAHRAGALPPSGQPFSAEHHALDAGLHAEGEEV